MKAKVNEAERETLDYMVAMAEGLGLGLTKGDRFLEIFLHQNRTGQGYCYSRSWLQAGPIIERERIAIYPDSALDEPDIKWSADAEDALRWGGPTPLIAAMRAYVVSKLGSEVEVPEELYE